MKSQGSISNSRQLIIPIFLLATVLFTHAQKLAWTPAEGYRVAKVSVAAGGNPGFTLITNAGIDFTNRNSYQRSEENQNLLNGAGVAAGDFDGDGWCDIYFANLEGANGLFRNLGGWKFQNVSQAANVELSDQASRAPILADLNGDRHLDLVVSGMIGTNVCYFNDGQGRFTNATANAGLTAKALGSQSMALADIDGDGDLDLYVTNYGENSILRSGGAITVRTVNGKPVIRGRNAHRLKIIDGQMIELGEPHYLYLNNGQGHFTAVSWTNGTFLDESGAPLKAAPPDMGLSVMFRDINRDGVPDIYVCNDFQSPDRIWINDGRGRFRALPALAIRSTSHFSMGVDFGDIDRDGFDDFFVSDMLSRDAQLRLRQIRATNPPVAFVGEFIDRQQFNRNALLLNRGDGTYAEIANFAGVDASDWSWSAVFIDVDLDGFEDLLVVNGNPYDTLDQDMLEKLPQRNPTAMVMGAASGKQLKEYPLLRTPNVAFRNRRDRTFEEVGKSWGFDAPQASHGIALVDLDNDGDQDVVVSVLDEPPLIYRNNSSAPRIAVRLKGNAPNTAGIGARITLAGGKFEQSQEMICSGRYMASDEAMRVFAVPDEISTLRLEVKWRSGQRSVISNLQANCIYEIDEQSAQPAPAPALAASPPPLFRDVSALLRHQHTERPFSDLERQPLLHRQHSTLGPGVAWFDLDRDGNDDLIIGAGAGSRLGVFRSDGKGGFIAWTDAAWGKLAPDDVNTVVGWTSRANASSVLLAMANFEEPSTAHTSLVCQVTGVAGKAERLPMQLPRTVSPISPGPCTTADVDGDGDLDVFIGGRVVPGRYPEPATSYLFWNENGALRVDETSVGLFRQVGLISGAVFSDLNSDGWPDLVLAAEWGPLSIYENNRGRLTKRRDQTLEKLTGWWNGVTTGDIDGDGQLDIVASNWGLNSSYREPVELYYLDIDGNSTLDLFETIFDPIRQRLAARRGMTLLSSAWPQVRNRFKSHQLYSQADLATVLGKPLAQVPHHRATTLASTCFFNRGSRFEPVPLPNEAQFAPAFGVNVADFDGDGREDVFLSQNFFGLRAEEPRLDSGRSVLLRNSAAGLESVTGQASGLIVHGDQRGSAACDYDADGRVDLVVTQNSGQTKLFHNEQAQPGLRVRLQGPDLNPSGIGAVMRLKFGQRLGPARAVHGGSGYLSYDSTVHVMATPTPPDSLEVRWPGGATTSHPIASGVKEITVRR